MLNDLWDAGEAPWKMWSVMTWADRRVLVTGATGMVGSWLTQRLVEDGALRRRARARRRPAVRAVPQRHHRPRLGRERRSPGRRRPSSAPSPATRSTPSSTSGHRPSSAPRTDPRCATLESNVHGHLERARGVPAPLRSRRARRRRLQRQGVRRADDAPVHGGHAARGTPSVRGVEVGADLITQAYAPSYGLPVAIARCGNIYGGGDLNWSRIVPGTIRSLLAASSPFSAATARSSATTSTSTTSSTAYLTLADAAERSDVRGTAFNFSDEAPVSVLRYLRRDLRRRRCRAHSSRRSSSDGSGEINDQYLDASRARTVLGWKPRVDRRRRACEQRSTGTGTCSASSAA